ncbi:extracellular solute-binding protein [Lederbergia wuyishanensis]|uniref:Aldouronate transport system substrate-binding protein n=1 Tax=Lederbergia wuyishanensis TaxID=1347903 RepID=A0ABU0D9Z2_9BACI|nr:extracellular solute-binding protein [Lederbergia wuyishanensis]MCJ8008501.1 extracellular solute-binding protein [Lederbergia wuyishanensis]MDQ0345244.1 putative aldouronate transport system substrate-binding protein [Lederbergia wuyishanensis]
MKKIIYFILASLLVLQVACSKDTGGNQVSKEDQLELLTDSGMPIAKEKGKVTLKMFAGMGNNTLKNWNDILVWNTYEELTNIKIEWDQQEPTALEEKRNLALAGGNLPDVFYAANMPTTDIYKYGQNGDFLELNELIENYAPNLNKLMENNPEIRKAITFPDGKIYSLPVIHDPEFTSVRTHPLMWYNSELLKKYSMDVPKTTDEFYQYLKTIQEKDPDIVPYGSWSAATLVNMLRGSFGVGTTGRAYIDKDPETGDVRFYPVTDNYKELLQFVHKLYSEKLIEQNIYSIEWAQFLNNGMEDKYGSMIFYAPEELFGKEIGGKYVGGLPLEGPNGEQQWSQYAFPVGHIGKFIITKKNPNPIATMRWVDYFYSDEGSRLFYMGVEGETYEKTADGKYKYLDKITNSSEGLTKEQEITKYLGWIGIGAPGILMEDYFDGSEGSDQALEAAKKVEPYLIDEVWPPFTYTEEENKKLDALAADIEKYVTEMQDKFIVGEEPFENWDKFVASIEKMGLEDYMKIQKAAYERYQKN